MTAMAPAVSRRLLAVLDLAERPGTDGERIGAEHAVGRLVLAHAGAIRAMLAVPVPVPREPAWRVLCDACLRHPRGLRSWEADFLRSLCRFPRCSPKQRTVLDAIAERLGLIGPQQ